MKKWKKFEEKTRQILEDFNPGLKVYGNVNIWGKFSKTSRQIDVQLVDANGYDFMVFECKDKKSKIDAPILEAFVTKLQNVGATRGAIVSNSSYTLGARNLAEYFGIDLLHLVDDSDNDINTEVYAGVVISDIMPKCFRVGIGFDSVEPVTFQDDVESVVFVDKGDNKITAREVFIGLWNNSDSLIKVPGAYRYEVSDVSSMKVQDVTGNLVNLKNVHFDYEVIEKYFFGNVKVINTSGIYNVKEKTYRTKSLHTEIIEPYEVEKKWQEIKSPKDVANQVTFEFSMISLYSKEEK